MCDSVLRTMYDDIPLEQFGGKASGLKWLHENGFCVPETYFSRSISSDDCTDSYYDRLSSEIKNVFPPNTKLAVRSSGIHEDGKTESKAGNYKTFLNVDSSDTDEILKRHKEIIADAKDKGDRSGVIFQKMISAEYAGVIFTSNPENYSKEEMVISYRKGAGEQLVSGQTSDTVDLTIRKKNPVSANSELKPYIERLVAIAVKIEELQNKPMDIEWAAEKATGKIYVLQCRPITTILLPKNEIKKVTLSSIGSDSRLERLDKVKIRLEAEKNDIMISYAYVVNCNCDTETFPFESIPLERSKFCKGYNIVVIEPKKIDGKIVRHFVGKKSDAIKCITCNRYNFRAFPKFEDIHTALCNIYAQVREFSWVCTMIIQEIFDPKYTGIIKQSGNATFIEVARGHFVAKGIVPMSMYVIEDGTITANEVTQKKFYRILEGHQIEQNIDEQTVHIDDDVLFDIQEQFKPILEKKNCNLEFGLLELDMELYPYLIDFTLDAADETLKKDDISHGVMSHGCIQGKLVKLESSSIEQSLNAHCQNQIEESYNAGEPIIYVCELPNVKFMEKLGRKNIGFVFRSGSLLCHLAILLRERHIPALLFDNIESLKIGEVYRIDTASAQKLKEVEQPDE